MKFQPHFLAVPCPLKNSRPSLMSTGWKMTANDFPVFLWSGDPPRNEYNEDAMTKVLFKDYVLERVMHQIFTGPSTSLGEDSCTTCSQCPLPRHSQISTLPSCPASGPFNLCYFPVHSRFHACFTSHCRILH
ncbi:hypothetical protein M405DRAFT_934622 [Rhizopogon salebrosus TDB-379]|nr:hypothetical protein M405DRAFT_934622 [Rhizopogon salebrosus TDB-379]